MNTLRISVSPDPLVAGQVGKVCYDFTGLSITSVELTITWDLPGGKVIKQVETVTLDSPCVTVPVPPTAGGVSIIDGSGNSPDYAGSVS